MLGEKFIDFVQEGVLVRIRILEILRLRIANTGVALRVGDNL